MRAIAVCIAALIVTQGVQAKVRPSMQERGEAELAKQLDGLVAGKPQNCIPLTQTDGSQIIDGTAILYRQHNITYVNRPLGATLLRDSDIPVQYVYGSQLCRLDRVNLLDRTTQMQRGTIGLGDFVPYTKPGTAR